MSINTIITIKNDGAAYLLAHLPPSQYFESEKNRSAVILQQVSYTLKACKDSEIELTIELIELTNKKCICRTNYRDTFYHIVCSKNTTDEKIEIGKITEGITNCLKKNSHSSNPAIAVQTNKFDTPAFPGCKDEDYNPICVHDLVHYAYLKFNNPDDKDYENNYYTDNDV